MKKGIMRILFAFGVAGSLVPAMVGNAHADSPGGCRYDYAAVGYGYSLKPCVDYAPAANYLDGGVEVKIDPNSTDVYVCGQLIPTSWLTSAVAGFKHCDYVGTSPNRTTYATEARFNDRCPLNFRTGDWVYDAWIEESGHRYGDVQSAPITCYH